MVMVGLACGTAHPTRNRGSAAGARVYGQRRFNIISTNKENRFNFDDSTADNLACCRYGIGR
jgi:hypothetical protein